MFRTVSPISPRLAPAMTPKRLLLLLALLVLLLAGLLMACSETEEPAITSAPTTATPTATATAMAGAGGGGGDVGPGDVVPPPSPPASDPTIPADWQTYNGSRGDWTRDGSTEGAFTLRFPSGWYPVQGAGISSWNTRTWNKPYAPADGIKIDITYAPSKFAAPRPEQATDISVGGKIGWEIVYKPDPPLATGYTIIHQVIIEKDSYTLGLSAYFAQVQPDEATFQKILSSVRFAQ